MLIYICYKESQYAAVCQFIPSVCVCVWEPVWSRLCRGMNWHTATYRYSL